MIVLDIETTGLDGSKSSILDIGAVSFENPQEQFFDVCKIFPNAIVLDEALAVNGLSLGEINDSKKQTEAELIKKFISFLEKQNDFLLAAHNPALDLSFIRGACERANISYPWANRNRTLDLHTLCYAHMIKRKIDIPMKDGKSALSADFVMDYVGIPREPRPHIGINGALWEAEAFSRLLHNENRLEQFSDYPIPWLT